jgi:hypothetical protein
MLADAILHVLYTLARWRFFMMPVFILGPFIAVWSITSANKQAASTIGGTSCRSARHDLWRGHSRFRPQPAELVHWFGAEGQATVTGSFDTGISYNDRRVMGHNVLIKTADARTIETSFDDDDFNVYPPKMASTIRRKATRSTSAISNAFPQDFIIISSSNDDSLWAKSLRCHELNLAVREADNKQQFAPDSSDFRKAYEDAVQAARAAGCDPSGIN